MVNARVAQLLSGCDEGKRKAKLLCDYYAGSEQGLIDAATRVAAGYPVQYAIGRWCFMDIELAVGEGVLIPRDETVTLAEIGLEHLKDRTQAFALDLCAGTGALALAIKAHVPDTYVCAVEKYPEAFGYLLANCIENGLLVSAVRADVFGYENELPAHSVDLIVCNPPYVSKGEYELVSPEVKKEPKTALVADNDGFEFFEYIAKNYASKLKKGGMLAFECGDTQSACLTEIMRESGFSCVTVSDDCYGRPRVVWGICD